jgi:AsmA protein
MSRAKTAASWASFVALAATILACGFMRWPVSAASVRSSLNAYSVDESTLRWAAPDEATFRALPWPSLHFYNARLGAGESNLLSAPEARVDLSLGELLRGRFIPTRTTLASPIITVDLNASPFSTEGRLDSIVNMRRALAPLIDVSLVNGVVRIVDKPHDFDTVIEDVRGRIEGIGAADSLRVNLSAVWRETPLTLSGSLASLGLTAAEGSALTLGIKSPIADFAVNGRLFLHGQPSLNGDVAVSVRSLSELARLTGLPRPAFLAADDLAVSAKIKAQAGDLTLGDATITSAGQALQGALRVSNFRGRAIVSGTLDSEQLAFEPLFGASQPLRNSEGEWSEHPFAATPPPDFDLDLRLSAASVDIYGRVLTNAAASVLLKGGELTVSLIEAGSYGGRIEGEARLSRAAGVVDLRVRAKLTDADFGAALSDLNLPVATGAGAVEVAIATGGRSPADAVARLTGTASLEGQQGSIVGINLEEALRRSQRRPLDVTRDPRTGQTAFDRISLSALIANGRANIANGELAARGLTAAIAGFIDLPAQSLDLSLSAVQTDASGEASQDAAQLTLEMSGPWSTPMVQASSPLEKNSR